jgi:peroxiredoxin
MTPVNRFFRITLFLLVLAFVNGHAGDKVKLGEAAPAFKLVSSSGETVSLDQYKGKIVVLEWINFGCPFVKKHYNSKNMQQLQKSFTEKDIIWLSICSSAEGKQGYMATEKEINEKLKSVGYNGTAYLIDESGETGRAYVAKTTPHMYVIDRKGILVYDGAIDNIKSTKTADIKKAENYVSKTLNALLAGEKVEPLKTEPYGCSVKY